VLANELRLEAAFAIAWDIDAQRPHIGQYGLGALAVAVVG